ncbi:MAG: DUF2271 domain-containing protein [Kofleriaceae bacterium]
MAPRRMLVPVLMVLTACEVGDLGDGGGGGGGGGGGADAAPGGAVDAAPGGGADADPGGTGNLAATFTPSAHNPPGPYAPKNVIAAWIETSGGAFVKTVGRWSAARTQHLVAWNAAAGPGDVDAVTGATLNTPTALNVTWNMRDRLGAEVPDGTYTLRLESADSNANNASQNNQGTFTFTKGAVADNQSGLTNGGFSAVSIDFTP